MKTTVIRKESAQTSVDVTLMVIVIICVVTFIAIIVVIYALLRMIKESKKSEEDIDTVAHGMDGNTVDNAQQQQMDQNEDIVMDGLETIGDVHVTSGHMQSDSMNDMEGTEENEDDVKIIGDITSGYTQNDAMNDMEIIGGMTSGFTQNNVMNDMVVIDDDHDEITNDIPTGGENEEGDEDEDEDDVILSGI
eukprot:473859_1